MGELEGRVIAVAGVGGGLGPVVAERLAGAGATLALADLDVDRIGAAVEGLGIPEERLDMQAVDLLDANAAASWCSSLQDRFGRVDGLLHLVGGWRGGDPIESFDMADYEWLHDLLVRTLQNVSRAFHGALTASEHGRFAIVSSTQAQSPDGNNAAYAATKAASESWTLALADSFAGSRATANVVVINAILTPGMRERNPGKEYPTFTPAEQIADALVYLCSDAAGADERPAAGPASVSAETVAAADPRGFASDNHSGAHPEVLEAIARANVDHAGSYGDDGWTARVDELFQEHFGPEAVGFPVFNGTAANVLALDALTRPHEARHLRRGRAYRHRRVRGPGALGRRQAAQGEAGGRQADAGGPACAGRPGAAISTTTSPGSSRSPRPPRWAPSTRSRSCGRSPTRPTRWGCYMHIDGARLANAAASLGVPLGTLAVGVEADVISLGATKNGGLVGDAVVFLDPGLGKGFEYIRKQGMQLASKMRFLSAQFEALLGPDELWRRNAEAANAMAARLGAGVEAIDGVELLHPVQANGVFVRLPAPSSTSCYGSSPASTPSTSGRRAPTRPAGCAPGTPPNPTSTPCSPRSDPPSAPERRLRPCNLTPPAGPVRGRADSIRGSSMAERSAVNR